ncbi:hypothetical protein WR25_02889 [Diploscapter pachys]|uniref:Uncharacterized protein n=1 Tax=Diploscapter pachys TaxID=2018661 RepID=A0A2A2K8U6_9BILA|nr:hypothetical protein WR25_02889 [Diploscapter pachys]
MPTNSVPWNEKPTIIATPIRAGRPPAIGASPSCQRWVPPSCPPSRMPSSIRMPTPMNRMMVTTLSSANQNSASPKKRTEATLRANSRTRKAALQITPGVSGNQ